MRVLITGAAGFLGSHLSERLLEDGHEVVGVDNHLTGRPANVAHLLETGRFHLVEQDVTEFLDVDGPLDAVLHFASPASPIDYLELPIQTLKVGSLGTHKTLGLAKAKGARYLLASTSEVYGDPLVNPQPESYWGNVNPVGPRGVYDEAKRFAEALAMAYHRVHGLDVKIVRIFNSVLGDEPLFFFNDDTAHHATGDEYAAKLSSSKVAVRRKILVPAFDPSTGQMRLSEASAFLKIPSRRRKDCYEVRLRYGRTVRVTGDHSLFVRGGDGLPRAKHVRDLTSKDHVAIPGRIPVVVKDRRFLDLAAEMIRRGDDADRWTWCVEAPAVAGIVRERRADIVRVLRESGRFQRSARPGNAVGCAVRSYEGRYGNRARLPLEVVRALGIDVPSGARLRRLGGGGRDALPVRWEITDELLWVLGFHLAEGSVTIRPPKTYAATLSSDQIYLDRARSILEAAGVRPRAVEASPGRAPSLRIDSRLYCWLIKEVLGIRGGSRERRIPAWVFQLPLERLGHFLEGYRCGDGTHSGAMMGKELAFNTASPGLADDLCMLLLRYGIMGSLGRYTTTLKGKRFRFFRVTICELSDFDVLSWHRGVRQTLNAVRHGDLVWAKVRGIEPCPATEFVYDFSVPDRENFVGSGVCLHNTYGPRMRPHDGRVVSNFLRQALAGEPLTIYGDGSQTRSFCYVEDEVEGIYRLLLSGHTGPMNIGNPTELTVRELAEAVRDLVGGNGRIEYRPLPQDDPRVRRPDITLARKVLGWEPRVDLRSGLERTIAWFRSLEPGGA